ncbi:MAG: RNA polymerase sigma-70 factor [Propionibacteriaceae bacterium]
MAMTPADDGAAESTAADLDAAAAVFTAERPRLFGIAYRMLGSVAEAEDIVQEAWLRWQNYDRAAVREPSAFLTTVTTRLAINEATSAHSRRETYVGPWLPEPVDTSADPALGAERGEALELAVLVLLERLSPVERAAYVLREAFDYPYARIATMLEISEANARQHVSRARRHLAAGRREPVSHDEQQRLLDAFLVAARVGDFDALEELLTADAVSYSDGGGLVRAARIPVTGATKVAKFVAAFAAPFWAGVDVQPLEANGAPAYLVRRDGVPVVLLSVAGTAEGIEQLLWIMNPDKLSRIGSTSGAGPAATA